MLGIVEFVEQKLVLWFTSMGFCSLHLWISAWGDSFYVILRVQGLGELVKMESCLVGICLIVWLTMCISSLLCFLNFLVSCTTWNYDSDCQQWRISCQMLFVSSLAWENGFILTNTYLLICLCCYLCMTASFIFY